MCKMVGVYLNSQVNYELEFKYEINEKEASYDGYGFGYFLNENKYKDEDKDDDKDKDQDKDEKKDKNKDNFKIFKKPLTKNDPKGKFSEKHSVQSDNLIVHIRYASSKNVDYENTHPFNENRLLVQFNGYTPKNLGQMELFNGIKNILSYFPSSSKAKEMFEGIGKNLSKVENSYIMKDFVNEFFSINKINNINDINIDFLKKLKSLLIETNKIVRLNLFVMFDDCLIIYQDNNGHNRIQKIDIENIKKNKNITDISNSNNFNISIMDQDLEFNCLLNKDSKGYIFLTENIKNEVKLINGQSKEEVLLETDSLNNSELLCLRKGEILMGI